MASRRTRDFSQVPAPSSIERVRLGTFGDVPGMGVEDRPLRPGRVVLGEPGDLVEQPAAPVVVEVDRGDALGPGGEAVADVALHGVAQIVAGQMDVDSRGNDGGHALRSLGAPVGGGRTLVNSFGPVADR